MSPFRPVMVRQLFLIADVLPREKFEKQHLECGICVKTEYREVFLQATFFGCMDTGICFDIKVLLFFLI